MARWMQYWSSCHANIRHQVINTAGTLNSHTTHQVSTHRCSVNSGNAHCRFPATAKAEAIFNLLIGGRGIVIPSHDMSPVCQCGGVAAASARLPGAGLLDSDLCLSPLSSFFSAGARAGAAAAAAVAARQLTRRHTAPPPHNTDTSSRAQELQQQQRIAGGPGRI